MDIVQFITNTPVIFVIVFIIGLMYAGFVIASGLVYFCDIDEYVPPIMAIKYSLANAYNRILKNNKYNILGQFFILVLWFIPVSLVLIAIYILYIVCCIIATIGRFLFYKKK